VAGDGFQALERLAGRRYDAVLMDVEMPGLDGLEATRRLRAMGNPVPIIAMTAHALASHRELCLAAGMDDCLTKPIDPERLFQVLGSWISKPALGEFAGLEAVMDVTRALELLDGRRDLLKHFLQAFLEDPANPESICQALAEGDRETACQQTHNLKGMAGSLAIPVVAQAAEDLENWLRRDEATGWEPLCERLRDAMEGFRTPARRLVASPKS
jgi:two-component system, sensor histidine kinase and response regulator